MVFKENSSISPVFCDLLGLLTGGSVVKMPSGGNSPLLPFWDWLSLSRTMLLKSESWTPSDARRKAEEQPKGCT
jgi:hypothetical protein